MDKLSQYDNGIELKKQGKYSEALRQFNIKYSNVLSFDDCIANDHNNILAWEEKGLCENHLNYSENIF